MRRLSPRCSQTSPSPTHPCVHFTKTHLSSASLSLSPNGEISPLKTNPDSFPPDILRHLYSHIRLLDEAYKCRSKNVQLNRIFFTINSTTCYTIFAYKSKINNSVQYSFKLGIVESPFRFLRTIWVPIWG